jgi:hypothetical protein
MNEGYLLACGIVWQKTGEPDAGWELIEALRSHDPYLQSLAAVVLVGSGLRSLELLQDAVRSGALTTEQAVPCIMDLLRSNHPGNGVWTEPNEATSSETTSAVNLHRNAGLVN